MLTYSLVMMSLTQLDFSDGTLAWIALGSIITFILSRKKGRPISISVAWSLLSGGFAYFLGGFVHGLAEKAAGVSFPRGLGQFAISSLGSAWCPVALRKVESKAESLGD